MHCLSASKPSQRAQNNFDDRESHHAANVLRVREGERVAVLNGAGTELMCEVAAVEEKGRAVEGAATKRYCSITVSITLLQAMTKGKSMDFIIQKATELCASNCALAAGRSVVQVDDVIKLRNGTPSPLIPSSNVVARGCR